LRNYQPKVSIEAGEVVGMEAPVRWKHPERGLAYPGEFIWFAEETGLIVPIGRWALREASRQVKEWQDQRASRTPLTMSVNLSAKQFEHPELTRDVAEILEEIGLDACRLELEITESILMDDAPLNAEIMRELKALGVKLSIDDFGTGYSSLSYLKRFPVEYLKIDRSFVSKLGEGPDDTALVSGVIGLAHTLSFKVVAEGVEAAEQLATLREVGCDLAQGYYLSVPLPSEAAKTLLDKRFPLVGGPR
jgi:EAL domain-containing protein (putative c-di-GMP-specific phosphodiesterase class I)